MFRARGRGSTVPSLWGPYRCHRVHRRAISWCGRVSQRYSTGTVCHDSMSLGVKPYRCGYDHGCSGQSHQRGRGLGGSGRKLLFLALTVRGSHVGNSAEKEAHSHNQKEIRQNGTQHRGLYDLDLALPQSNNADLQPRRVSLEDSSCANSGVRGEEQHPQSARQRFQRLHSPGLQPSRPA